ncbi:M48 family metallopeptidase [Candidatus Nomurabacteria bacterium]|nr:M48 family metallopeptidase [Candidatus Nomurabacteria bacterium]
MASFFVLIIAIGWAVSYVYQSPRILYFAVIFSIFMNVLSYWYSDKIVLKMTGAVPAEHNTNTELYHIVENLSITAGLPMPKIYIVNDPSPNAFATGRDKDHAVVAVTSGLLSILDKNELEGVIAHELSHIGNRDILLSTIVVVLVGFISILSDIFIRSSFGVGKRQNDREGGGGILAVIGIILIILSPIVATLIQLAISRKREFLADASGALLTRYPEGLASALKKISEFSRPMKRASNATAHLFISNPFGAKRNDINAISKLFMTHPPVEERISALLNKN